MRSVFVFTTIIILIPLCVLLVPLIDIFIHAQANAGCERLSTFAPVPSPDGRWVAVMHTDACSDGAFTTSVSDSVDLISAIQPSRKDEVFGEGNDERPGYLPVLTWTAPDALRITVPSYSGIGLYVREFDAVKVDLQSKQDDPASRAAFLKRLGLPPDSPPSSPQEASPPQPQPPLLRAGEASSATLPALPPPPMRSPP